MNSRHLLSFDLIMLKDMACIQSMIINWLLCSHLMTVFQVYCFYDNFTTVARHFQESILISVKQNPFERKRS